MKKFLVLLTLLFLTSFVVHADPIPFKTGTVEEIVAAIDTAVANKTKDQQVIASLAMALKDDEVNVKVKERAAWALGELERKDQVKALLEASKHKGLLVRSAALGALIHLRAPEGLSRYIDIAQNDPILSQRQQACLALGLLQSEKTIKTLVALSSDPKEEIRGTVMLAMAATHSKKNDFRELLKEMTGDPSQYVQQRAKVGLDITGGKNAAVLPHLKSQDPDIRLFAAVYFHKRGTSKELEPLKDAMSGEPNDETLYEMKNAITSIKKRVAAAAAAAKKKAAAKKAAAQTQK